MRARTVVVLQVAVLVYYVVVAGQRGVELLRDDRLIFRGLGVGVLLLPVVGVVLVVGELRFGRASERLGRALSADPDPVLDQPVELARRPSGRIDRAAADEVFAVRRAQVEEAPGDWRRWYRLGMAYGDAGDTARGRRAVRRAIALEAEQLGR